MKPILASACLLGLLACGGPIEGARESVDLNEQGDRLDDRLDGDSPDVLHAEAPDRDREDTSDEPDLPDDPDPPDDDDDLGWDAAPPDAVDGTSLVGVVTCALLDGGHIGTYVKDGEVWEEVEIDGFGPYPDLQVCMERVDSKYLEWTDEPAIYMNAAGLDHDLTPTKLEDRWFGWVSPTDGDSSPECLAALKARGLSWPVAISFEVLSVTPPD